MHTNNLRRRRGPAFVTPNACTECRRKRVKCDGKTPCGRCLPQGGIECVYEVPTRQSKEDMRKEISQLRAHQRQTEQILGVLAAHGHSEEPLNQPRNGDTLQNLTGRLRSSSLALAPSAHVTTYTRFGDHQAINNALEPAQSIGKIPSRNQPLQEAFQIPSQGQQSGPSEPGGAWPNGNDLPNDFVSKRNQPNAMNWTADSTNPIHSSPCYPAVGVWRGQPTDPVFGSVPHSATHRGQDLILEHGAGPGNISEQHESNPDYESWTTVTRDRDLVEHLLALYFCWEYPIFASLSKEHFLEDFRRGIPRYCCQLLVNALLALACGWSDRSSARADPEDSATAGDHFFSEALRLYEAEEDHRVLTTIQALGIMSIREASCGRVSESIFFSGQSIRLALEMGLHLDAEDIDDEAADVDEAVRGATFWGAFALDEAWSLCCGKLPHFSASINLTAKPAIIQEVESAPWILYTDDGAPLEQNCTQPSNLRSVYKTFCELSEIVHRTLYALYTPGSDTKSKVLLDAYSQYILWYDTVSTALRLGHNFTPAVLFAHLYYHFTILMLFRPFVKLRIIGSDVSPRNVCTQAANAISAIIRSYSNLYTLRRTPSFVPYIVLSSSIFHLAMVHEDKSSVYSRGQLAQNISDLKEMSSCHGFAARALDILQFLAQLWEVDGIFNDAYDGANLHNHSHPSFILMGELSPLTGSVSMMHNIAPWPSLADNPRFVPFPLQGRPTVTLGSKLEEDGFAALPVHEQV